MNELLLWEIAQTKLSDLNREIEQAQLAKALRKPAQSALARWGVAVLATAALAFIVWLVS